MGSGVRSVRTTGNQQAVERNKHICILLLRNHCRPPFENIFCEICVLCYFYSEACGNSHSTPNPVPTNIFLFAPPPAALEGNLDNSTKPVYAQVSAVFCISKRIVNFASPLLCKLMSGRPRITAKANLYIVSFCFGVRIYGALCSLCESIKTYLGRCATGAAGPNKPKPRNNKTM